MSVIKIQLIVITSHMHSRKHVPQDPKSMISLNHQAPAVNQDTLVQHYCSSIVGSYSQVVFGFGSVW